MSEEILICDYCTEHDCETGVHAGENGELITECEDFKPAPEAETE